MTAAVPLRPADVDLDLREVAGPAPDREPNWRGVISLAVALSLTALLAAAGAHAALRRTSTPLALRITAAMTLTGVVAAPQGVAHVELVLANRGPQDVVVTRVEASGGGLAATTVPVQRVLAPAESVAVDVGVPISCTVTPAQTDQPRIRILARPASPFEASSGEASNLAATTSSAVTDAVGTLRTERAADVCATAALQLAAGWATPLQVRDAHFDGGRLRLVASGVPDGAALLAAWADDWLVAQPPGVAPAVPHAGVLDVLLDPPVPGCADLGARGVVPTGLQLVVTPRTGGMLTFYAPVGPNLARWLLDARERACPGQPWV